MNRQAILQPQVKSAPPKGPVLQRQCACGQHTSGGECEECKKKRLQRRASDGKAGPTSVPPMVGDVLRSSGRPLDHGTRRSMERSLGHDFSGVRVHTDSRANQSAQALSALAYTVGRDLVFGAGQYQPGTRQGDRLIAHELSHVVQQRGFTASGFPTIFESPAHESEAERAADIATVGERDSRTPGTSLGRVAIQRAPDPEGEDPGRRKEKKKPGEPTESPPAEELTPGMRRQIAWQLREAMAGWGTDEDSIYSALAGRTERQIEEIRETYQEMYPGRNLEADLRDELNTAELGKLANLAPTAVPVQAGEPKGTKAEASAAGGRSRQMADAVAGQLEEAMRVWGTDEESIFSALTGRLESERTAIKEAYQRLTHRELEADLRDELSGTDLQRALALLNQGLLNPEDQIHVATAGLGTDEDLLFETLEPMRGDLSKINATIDAYRDKGYGDMLEDIRDDLSGSDLDRAMEILHGATTSTANCSTDERSQGLLALDTATSRARNAASKLDAAVAKGVLSGEVKIALETNFNGGGAKGGVTAQHAQLIARTLEAGRAELLSKNAVTCNTPVPLPCGADPCSDTPDCSSFVAAWTCHPMGSIVRLCKGFFTCCTLFYIDQATAILHEFIHHQGTHDIAYKSSPVYEQLRPLGNKSSLDSLDNADSYAQLAKDLA